MSPEENDFLGEPLPVESTEDTGSEEQRIEPSKKIHSFSGAAGLEVREKYKRTLNKTGEGATRMRIFHAKLSDSGLMYIQEMINEWLDDNPEIEIKHTNTTVGILEAKRSEPNLLLTVWY